MATVVKDEGGDGGRDVDLALVKKDLEYLAERLKGECERLQRCYEELKVRVDAQTKEGKEKEDRVRTARFQLVLCLVAAGAALAASILQIIFT